jgi:hypothetical protein
LRSWRKAWGWSTDLLGKEKIKNVLNDVSSRPTICLSTISRVLWRKAAVALHFLLSRLHVRCMFHRAFLWTLMIAGQTHAEGRARLAAVSSGDKGHANHRNSASVYNTAKCQSPFLAKSRCPSLNNTPSTSLCSIPLQSTRRAWKRYRGITFLFRSHGRVPKQVTPSHEDQHW